MDRKINVRFFGGSERNQRNQRVVVNGTCSAPIIVLSGVPPGTVLAPLVSLILVNDIGIILSSKTNLRLFADGAVLYRSMTTENDARIFQ